MKIGKYLALSHFGIDAQVDNLAEELENCQSENTRGDLDERLDKVYTWAGSGLIRVMPSTGRNSRREAKFDKLWKRRVYARRFYASDEV